MSQMDFSNLFGKVKEMQEKIKEVQERVKRLSAEGESGAGMVRATVSGERKVISIEIDDSLVNNDDKELIQDLSVAAVNSAMGKIDTLIKEEMSKVTGGLPNIPGFQFPNL